MYDLQCCDHCSCSIADPGLATARGKPAWQHVVHTHDPLLRSRRRASALDDALLRPGRFDRKIYMGHPSEQNRLRILQVHARDKPIDRTDDDAVLKKVRGRSCNKGP